MLGPEWGKSRRETDICRWKKEKEKLPLIREGMLTGSSPEEELATKDEVKPLANK